jgi:hypothetical protein
MHFQARLEQDCASVDVAARCKALVHELEERAAECAREPDRASCPSITAGLGEARERNDTLEEHAFALEAARSEHAPRPNEVEAQSAPPPPHAPAALSEVAPVDDAVPEPAPHAEADEKTCAGSGERGVPAGVYSGEAANTVKDRAGNTIYTWKALTLTLHENGCLTWRGLSSGSIQNPRDNNPNVHVVTSTCVSEETASSRGQVDR